ncbi:MAG: anti-sigma factor [Bacteroidetes bacterium]|nr:anti-sigma factor [Bacteroidota bacterium]
MDPKKYIESGIIDDYVMGFVSEQEQREVQCLSKIYPEINEALRQAEDLMGTWALESAMEPPAGLKEKIMANLGEQEPAPVVMSPIKETEDDKKVIPLNREAADNKPPLGWIAAAAAILLSFFMAYQWQDSLNFMRAMEQEIVSQDQDLEDLQNKLQYEAKDRELYQGLWAAVSEPGVQRIELNAVKEDQSALATVYWNPESEKTFVFRDQLPQEGNEAQYQLWAIVAGKPVSIGLLDQGSTELQLQNMAAISDADAFAITLEPLGGSENPTMEQMVVLGKV